MDDILHIQLPYDKYDFFGRTGEVHELPETIMISGPMEIKSYSFNWESRVKKIIIADDVTGIEDYNFQGFKSLEEITFGRGLKYIGHRCFRDLESLRKVVLPGNIKSIGIYAFENCPALRSVTLLDGVESVGAGVFYNCGNLADVSFPLSVKEIGKNVLEGSEWLRNHPDDFVMLGHVLFTYKGPYMDRITIPDTVEYIRPGGQFRLGRNVDYGVNTKVIPARIALENRDLETAVFHDRLERIGNSAFSGCAELKPVHIPDSVRYIGNNAFAMRQLADAPKYGCVHVGRTVCRWLGDAEEAVIPEGPETISPVAFECKKKLAKVVIPSTVKTIYRHAFSECPHLEIVVIPDSVTEIDDKAFLNCSAFTIVTSEGSYADRFAKAHHIPVAYGNESAEPGWTQQEREEQEGLLAIRKHGGEYLRRIEPGKRTYKVCLAAVAARGSALEFVPEKHMTAEMCKTAVMNHGYALRFVPEERRTAEICEAAVMNKGSALEFVPEKHRTAEICEKAVRNYGDALCFVPEKYRTEELCIVAVKNGVRAIEYVPAGLMTPAFCVKAGCESCIPEQYQTAKFYRELVALNPKAFGKVPKTYCTAAVCRAYFAAAKYKSTADAVRHSILLIGWLPASLFDHETSLVIVETREFRLFATDLWEACRSGRIHFLEFPYQLETAKLKKMMQYPDVLLKAFALNIEMIRFAPKKILTPEMLMKLMEIDCRVFPLIPEDLRSAEICECAVRKNPKFIKDVPAALRSEELCRIAALREAMRKGSALEDVPREQITQETCDRAFEASIMSIKDIPDRFVTEEMLCVLAKEAPRELKIHFPVRLRSEALFEKLIRINPQAEYYIRQLSEKGQ